MKKHKVCFVTPFFLPTIGGVETHIYNISKELIKLGYEVEVFTSDMDRDRRIEKKEEVIDGIKIKRFRNWLKVSFAEMFFPGVFAAVKKTDADIIHVHTYRHLYNLVFLFTKKPVFLTPHWPIYKGQRNPLIQLIVDFIDNFLGRFIFKNFSKVCVVSGLESPWVQSFGVDKKDIVLTPNCLPDYYFKEYDGENFRNKYGFSEDEIVVLTVSRIHKSKGIDQVVKVAKFFPQVKFVIMGKDDGYLKKLKNQISKFKINENVIITGRVSETEKLEAYAGADIFCSPSHFEAFCISILEAMSQGCSVLTSDQGGMPWVVSDVGLIFEDDNLKDLREKLTTLINDTDLRKKLFKKGKERAKKFTWDKVAKTLDLEYKKI